MPKDTLRIYSWNVNGLRACAKKGFMKWLRYARADVVALQETRARVEQLDPAVASPRNWHTHFSAAERGGYSGVGLYSRRAPDDVETSLGDAAIDAEGRLQIARFGELIVANGYFPNGSGRDRDHSRVPFKLDFYRKVFDALETERKAGAPILVMGDFNTAVEEIDLARPKSNRNKTSGFLDEERDEVRRWLDAGWVDTFRHFHPDAEGQYTWWSQRFGVREKNVGWRIDMVLASEGAMDHLRAAKIHPKVMGSDHCPISVELDPVVFG